MYENTPGSGVSASNNDDSANVIVHTALLVRIEALESSYKQLSSQLSSQIKYFRLEHISHDDSLVQFYTGFNLLISKYFTTWISFLYHHLSELQWMPTVEQVSGNLPQAFRDKI